MSISRPLWHWLPKASLTQQPKKIKERNVFPAICGRVCPQESQCEAKCIMGVKDDPVAIGRLERFVADFERKMDLIKVPIVTKNEHKKIAVIGSGPGGLTVAADMRQLGYSVTVFEALHELGGVLDLRHPGIPSAQVNRPVRDRLFKADGRPFRAKPCHRKYLYRRRAAGAF